MKKFSRIFLLAAGLSVTGLNSGTAQTTDQPAKDKAFAHKGMVWTQTNLQLDAPTITTMGTYILKHKKSKLGLQTLFAANGVHLGTVQQKFTPLAGVMVHYGDPYASIAAGPFSKFDGGPPIDGVRVMGNVSKKFKNDHILGARLISDFNIQNVTQKGVIQNVGIHALYGFGPYWQINIGVNTGAPGQTPLKQFQTGAAYIF